MAIDTADKKTSDAFKRGRGRPRTSSPEKRRADNAERQRRYRDRQRLIREITTLAVESNDGQVFDFLAYLTTGQCAFTEFSVTLKKTGTGYKPVDITPADLEQAFADGFTVEFK